VLLALGSIVLEFAIYAGARAASVNPTAIAVMTIVIAALVDAFPVTVATLDAGARSIGTPGTTGALLRAAARRYPIVAVVNVFTSIVQFLVAPTVFGSLEETYGGLLIVPGLLALGALSLPSVVAALESSERPLGIPGIAVVRGMLSAAGWPNIALVTIAGALAAVPTMAQEIVTHWMDARQLPLGDFWANIPIDALTVAPYQAFFTYLFLALVALRERR
jgi:hypothetical protein